MSIITTTIQTLINIELKTINDTNPFPDTGNITLMTDPLEELREMLHFDLKEGDQILYYDFVDDELKRESNMQYSGSEHQIWYKWLDEEFFPYVRGHMSELGYNNVDDCDGSGGGLVYGGMHFTRS